MHPASMLAFCLNMLAAHCPVIAVHCSQQQHANQNQPHLRMGFVLVSGSLLGPNSASRSVACASVKPAGVACAVNSTHKQRYAVLH
jgi:hypothetical protein